MIKPSIVSIEEKDLQEFRPVNETLATDILLETSVPNHQKFTTADLWKCRKKRKLFGIKIR